MKNTYRMPDGKYVFSSEEYCAAWKDLAAHIEKATDSTLVAYDPDLCFQRNDVHSLKWWTLPPDIAKLLNAALTSK